MSSAVRVSEEELQRVARLQALEVLDTAAEPVFDSLARAASAVCGTPIALVSLIDEHRQWFKANVGLEDTPETPRNISFCTHAIQGSELFEIGDATRDSRFRDNPLVTSGPAIRFYAGAPLVLPTGERMGTLCVIDRQPRTLTDAQRRILADLATTAVQALELRRHAHHFAATGADPRFRTMSEASPFGIFHMDIRGRCTYTNPRWQEIFQLSANESLGDGWRQALHPDDHEAVNAEWFRCVRAGLEFDMELRLPRPDGDFAYVRATARPHVDASGKVSGYVGAVYDITLRRKAEEQLRAAKAFLDRAERIAGVGGWELDLVAGTLNWTDETCRIYDLPAGHRPSLDEHLKYFSAESAELIRRTAFESAQSGKPWDLELPMTTASGRKVWVRSVGQVVAVTGGKPTHLVGALQNITDKKATESELLQAHALLKTMLETLPCGVSVVDANLNVVAYNQQFKEVQSFPDSLFDGPVTPFESLVRYNAEHGEYGEGDAQELAGQIMARARNPSVHRYERTRPNGMTLEIQGAPMPGGGFVTTYTDVSDRKRSEAALRVSEERQQRAMDASGLALWDCDLDTGDVYVSEAWSEMLGEARAPTATDVQALISRVPDEEQMPVINAINALIKGEVTTYSVEHRVRRADGSLIWVQSEGRVAERDGDGRAHRIVGTNRNITGRRKAEDELKRLSSLLMSVLDAATEVAVVAVDTTGMVTVFNKGAELILGYSSDDVVGKLKSSAFHDTAEVEARQRELSERLGHPVSATEAFSHPSLLGKPHEWTYVRKDGSRLPISLVVTEVRSSSGELLGRLGTAHDITRQKDHEGHLKAARDAAEQATQEKAAFLANMSHEIRTPMNGVIGMTSLLLDTALSPEQREFTEVIRRSGEGLLVVINDILDYSKIEAGQMELERIALDLQEAVESSIELLAQKAQEKKLDLLYLIEPDVPRWVLGDFPRLRQVLVNLLSNALKFTETGEVLLTVRRKAGSAAHNETHEPDTALTLEFAVRDTGIGIPADKLPRLFQAFSQADSSTSRKYGGTGLGLAISSRLVEGMQGRMWAESWDGLGSTFSFTIQTAAASPAAPLPSLDLSSLQGKSVLLVDDNPTNLRILGLQTARWGLASRAFASAGQALDVIRNGAAPDLLVTDLHMPEMDGLEFSRAVRALKPALPIVLLSSSSARQLADAALFAAVLMKPARELALWEALARALSGGAAAPVAAPASAPSQFDVTLARRFPLRILLAEDNEINRQVAVRVLKGFGYHADVAANGLEAVAAVQRQTYDLVLMDIQMPEMDGLEATRQIVRGRPEARRPKIVGMSANALREDIDAALEAGMNDYIVKPFAVAALRAKLEHFGAGSSFRPQTAEPVGPAGAEVAPADAQAPAAHVKDDLGHALLDLKQVHSLIELDPSGNLLGKLSQSFGPQSEKLLQSLGDAAAASDAVKAGQIAHQYKGLSGTLGMSRLAQQAAALEVVIEACDWDQVASMLALAKDLSTQSLAALKAELEAALKPSAG